MASTSSAAGLDPSLEVEVLTGDHLGAQPGEQLTGAPDVIGLDAAAVEAVEELVRPHEGEVAGEDRGADTEPGGVAVGGAVVLTQGVLCRRSPTTRRRAVHHVVVEQGEAVQQLDGSGGVERRGVVSAAGGEESGGDERRAEPLAAGEREVADRPVQDGDGVRASGTSWRRSSMNVTRRSSTRWRVAARTSPPPFTRRLAQAGNVVEQFVDGVVAVEPLSRHGHRRQTADLGDRPGAQRRRCAARPLDEVGPASPTGGVGLVAVRAAARRSPRRRRPGTARARRCRCPSRRGRRSRRWPPPCVSATGRVRCAGGG